jgi:hypothetical protein
MKIESKIGNFTGADADRIANCKSREEVQQILDGWEPPKVEDTCKF